MGLVLRTKEGAKGAGQKDSKMEVMQKRRGRENERNSEHPQGLLRGRRVLCPHAHKTVGLTHSKDTEPLEALFWLRSAATS